MAGSTQTTQAHQLAIGATRVAVAAAAAAVAYVCTLSIEHVQCMCVYLGGCSPHESAMNEPCHTCTPQYPTFFCSSFESASGLLLNRDLSIIKAGGRSCGKLVDMSRTLLLTYSLPESSGVCNTHTHRECTRFTVRPNAKVPVPRLPCTHCHPARHMDGLCNPRATMACAPQHVRRLHVSARHVPTVQASVTMPQRAALTKPLSIWNECGSFEGRLPGIALNRSHARAHTHPP